jgi:hypothetical protein
MLTMYGYRPCMWCMGSVATVASFLSPSAFGVTVIKLPPLVGVFGQGDGAPWSRRLARHGMRFERPQLRRQSLRGITGGRLTNRRNRRQGEFPQGRGVRAQRDRDRHRSLVLAHLEEAPHSGDFSFAGAGSADRAYRRPHTTTSPMVPERPVRYLVKPVAAITKSKGTPSRPGAASGTGGARTTIGDGARSKKR